VWLQNNRLMLHHLAREHQTLVAGRSVEWATLEPAETLQIGPHVIAFETEGAQPGPAAPPADLPT
jgi:hypothetical protein